MTNLLPISFFLLITFSGFLATFAILLWQIFFWQKKYEDVKHSKITDQKLTEALDITTKKYLDQSLIILRTQLQQINQNILKDIHADSQHLKELYLANLQKSFEDIAQELKDNKEQKISALNDRLFILVNRLAQDTIGKSLSPKEHEELVLHFLSQSKRL